MPALACSASVTIGYAPLSGDSSLPALESFSGAPPAMSTASAAVPFPLPWSPDLSASLYRLDAWGAPYFAVNSAGNVTIRPHGADTLPHQEVDLMKVVRRAAAPKSAGGLGLPLPLIVRLPDVLRSRLSSLQSAFDVAVRAHGYASHYQGVYPVKCNQDRFVVEDVVDFGAAFRFGLEAGSKPELLLAMSCLVKGSPDAFLVCNGYKDPDYISMALMAQKLGLKTVIVLEQEEEIDLVIDISAKLGVRPVIGLRAKLRTKHSGHFGSTSGEKGKFGLTTAQILTVVRKLRATEMLDCLQLLHFHIGSQIPSTTLLAEGVSEAAQIYCELVRLGAGMRVIDIGGGLGIDYDGSHSPDSDMSVGYSLEEYASAVVQAVRNACDQKFVRHPVLCSESGRALVSHHSVLIFEAVSASAAEAGVPPIDFRYLAEVLPEEARADYRNLTSAAVRRELEACLVYADQLKRRCVDQFRDGVVGLEHLAAVDGICDLVAKAIGAFDPVRIYHVNLSIFTSIPDFWAIGQLFPIMPIHRLNEQPTVRATLSDLTCDSDGKVDKFIGGATSLPLHEMAADGSGCSGGYYLGMFLGGAYQEALGGLHNLFGGPSVVRVAQSDGPLGFAVTRAVPGPSCADVLRAMQHEPELMFATLKCRAEELSEVEGGAALARAFNSMPYLAPTGVPVACAVSYAGGGQDDGLAEEEWAAATTYCCA